MVALATAPSNLTDVAIVSWYEELDRQLANSEIPLSGLLNEKFPQPWAIPFFGRFTEAKVLTVGLNPSFGEFSGFRWSNIRSAAQAVDRLLNYFSGQVEPHPWFATWELALNALDASYYGTRLHLGAHIDIWPRATGSISGIPKEQLEQSIAAELSGFISTLERAANASLLLMAGSVTEDYYVNQFLQNYLPADKAKLELSFSPKAQPGPGKTVFQRLCLGHRILPVFFCSTSPSDDENRSVLVQKVQELALPIKNWGKL